MRFRRWSAWAGAVAVVVLATGSTAWAHITTDPATAVKGAGDQVFTFRVPNEEPGASTTSLKLQLPQDHPIAAVDVLEMPGWTSAITTRHLDTPLKTDDGTFSDVASEITWTGGSITPGHYGEFRILAMGLPSDTDTLTFKAVQGYSDGTSVSWIDTGAGAEFPAPVVKLTAAAPAPAGSGSSHHGATATTAAPTAATSSHDSSSDALGVTGIIVGAAALVASAVAILLARRKAPVSP
ncbi:MAG: hypothetical protein JWL73_2811 [Actinomycetia bacterium]|nr:hypothetical protein [Actinomycetes bacterium]